MNLITPRRSLAAIGALAAAAALAVTLETGAFAGSHRVSQLAPAAPVAAAGAVAPTGTPTSATADAQGNIGLADAEAVAARAAGGRAIDASVDDEAATPTYDVTVLRADGTQVDVTVDGSTGRVVTQRPDGPDTADQPGATDTPEPTADRPSPNDGPDNAG